MGHQAVVGLACFPVKSMLGEERERLVVDERGVAGDRLWALRYEDVRPGDPRVGELFGAETELAREGEVSHQDAGAVSLVGTASLAALGELLADSGPVDVRRLRGTMRIERCVMTTLAQREPPADHRVPKTLTASRGTCIGVYADVATPGTLEIGAKVTVK
ncbi:MOSC N-terminal beta barrel domain-containing protein [Streptomyces sp. NPDC058257]|uniref:MOSC N-terminal beta barrel domain-containing protein n=1 Tax=Streptomyces sp. NPDC058257 TaxID=3346409 RepID=UPI0036E32938